MNEYKIQLESREDLTYLRDEMNKFLNENCEENCGKLSDVIKQQVNRK
jgi:Fe-S cluster biosynthesis and repair protein YggX